MAGLASGFDEAHGGFGGAPKFPPSMALEFLLRHHERTGGAAALSMAEATCEAMARGGIYDQLGGGFARYSVDASWTVPHFEKMLYDNALLAGVYTHLWRLTGSALARRVAEETCDFMVRELRTPEGGLSASLDADSDGAEGVYYVWTPAELVEVLGPDDGAFAARVFGVTEQGTFEHGASVLQLRADPEGTPHPGVVPDPEADARPGDGPRPYPAALSGISPDERLSRIRGLLLTAREGRTRPARDDKVVAAWNGMAIGALAEAGVLFGRPDFVTAAEDAAGLLVSLHYAAGRIVRTSRGGVAGPSAGLLEDYACVAAGLLRLAGVTGQNRWVAVAGALLDSVLSLFGDAERRFLRHRGGRRAADLPARRPDRQRDPVGRLRGRGRAAQLRGADRRGPLRGGGRGGAAGAAADRRPLPAAGGLGLSVAEALLSGPAEIAIVGPDEDPRTADLLRAALHAAPPGAVLALGYGAPDAAPAAVPLLSGRPLVSGRPAAYVCRGFTCLAPVTTTGALREALLSGWTNV